MRKRHHDTDMISFSSSISPPQAPSPPFNPWSRNTSGEGGERLWRQARPLYKGIPLKARMIKRKIARLNRFTLMRFMHVDVEPIQKGRSWNPLYSKIYYQQRASGSEKIADIELFVMLVILGRELLALEVFVGEARWLDIIFSWSQNMFLWRIHIHWRDRHLDKEIC